jgi:cysteine desulfurase
MGKRIYLDYASTTPIDPKVLRSILPYLKNNFGNPSSVHYFGQKARTAIDLAREKVAKFLGCSSEEVIFTGSATEANNLAIKGLTSHFLLQTSNFKPHIITTQIEHKSVLETCKNLERKGAEVTYLPVDDQGLISVSHLAKKIKENTILVSIMYANNEIGAIQPVVEIGKLLKNINKIKEKSKIQKTYFHTDAVQTINWLDCKVERLGVDFLTLSGHKIYGPKGIGALYIKKGTPIEPQITGGGQEEGLRSGTENVAGIVGLGKAIDEVGSMKYKVRRVKRLKNKLIKGILQNIPDVKLNGSLENSLPNIANFSFKGAEGEAIVIALDQEGICVSTGSACAAKSLEPSHVLLALGLTEEEAHTSVRFSLGKYTTAREINYVLKILPGVVERLRKISGYN